ncbi:hypothetical protein [Candidatus Nitrososphaera evergladensis]|nr:hypothetical protein [Candidatus Nitrososphaera evergladensis]
MKKQFQKKMLEIAARTTIASIIVFMAAAPSIFLQPHNRAYAHVLGITREVDNKYLVSFQLIPQFPSAGNRTDLHFSIKENNSGLSNVNLALQIVDKKSGAIVHQMPYKTYEISDVSIPYTFQNNSQYTAKLLMRLDDGNAEHMKKPLEADFDVNVRHTSVISAQELLVVTVPFTAGLVGGIFFLFKKVR